jgi:hypothetical protein
MLTMTDGSGAAGVAGPVGTDRAWSWTIPTATVRPVSNPNKKCNRRMIHLNPIYMELTTRPIMQALGPVRQQAGRVGTTAAGR